MITCTICTITKELNCYDKKRRQCKDCRNNAKRPYYWKNREKILQQVKLYKEHNKEKVLLARKRWYAAHSKEYYQKTKTMHATKSKKYRGKDLERHRAKHRQWVKNNPAQCNFLNAKRRAIKLQRTPKWLTALDWQKIDEYYKYAAFLSDSLKIPHEVDHIIPLCGETISGLHCPSNLQILTASENAKKHNKYPYNKEN